MRRGKRFASFALSRNEFINRIAVSFHCQGLMWWRRSEHSNQGLLFNCMRILRLNLIILFCFANKTFEVLSTKKAHFPDKNHQPSLREWTSTNQNWNRFRQMFILRLINLPGRSQKNTITKKNESELPPHWFQNRKKDTQSAERASETEPPSDGCYFGRPPFRKSHFPAERRHRR